MKLRMINYPIGIGWLKKNYKAPNENALFLHGTYFKHRRKYLRNGKLFKGILDWFWKDLIINSKKLVATNGEKVQELTGASTKRQYFDLVRTCLTIPCRPQDYYIYELYLPKKRKKAKNIIFRYEVKNFLYYMMLGIKKVKAISPLTDKGDFQNKAKENNLPTVPSICTIKDGLVEYCDDKYIENPKSDLFVKALDGRGGRGAQVWRYSKKNKNYRLKGRKKTLTFAELIEHFKQNSTEKPMIIQKKINNHPDLKDLSCNALSTYRVVTILNEKNEPEVVAAVFRMAARKGKVVDNIHKGGIAAPINIKKGTLGKATNLGKTVGLGRLSTHPVTNAQIEGRKLPKWDEVVNLTTKAHKCFNPRVIVGWDISVTKDGPVIIEGNAQPCVDLIQRVSDKPLSKTRFGDLMVHNLKSRGL